MEKTKVFVYGKLKGQGRISREEFQRVQDNINSLGRFTAVIPHDLFDGVDVEALNLFEDRKIIIKELLDCGNLVYLPNSEDELFPALYGVCKACFIPVLTLNIFLKNNSNVSASQI